MDKDKPPKKWTCYADAYEDGVRFGVRIFKDLLSFGWTVEEIEEGVIKNINNQAKHLREIEGIGP